MEIVESFFLAEALLIVNLEEQTIQSFWIKASEWLKGYLLKASCYEFMLSDFKPFPRSECLVKSHHTLEVLCEIDSIKG